MAAIALSPQQRHFLETYVLKSALPEEIPLDQADMRMVSGVLSRLNSLPPAGATLLGTRKAKLTAGLAEVRERQSKGDMSGAATRLSQTAALARDIGRDIGLVRTYVGEKQAFAQRLSEAQSRVGGNGGIAIEDYVTRLREDDQRRATAEKRGDIRMALVACNAQEHRHDAMMQDADRGKEFVDLRAALQAEIDRLSQIAGDGGYAKPAIERAVEAMEDAVNFTKSGNWVGAVMLMRKAKNALKVDVASLDMMSKLDDTDQDADFDTAHTRCLKLLAGYKRMPSAKLLKRELFDVASKIAAAKQALPDMEMAHDLISTAQKSAADLGKLLVSAARYKSAAEAAAAQRKSLGKMNIDKCIASELSQVDALLKTVSKKANRHDFDAAEKTLAEIQTALGQAHDAASLYSETIRTSRRAVAQTIRSKDLDEAQKGKLVSIFDDMAKAFDSRNLREAERLAQEALQQAS